MHAYLLPLYGFLVLTTAWTISSLFGLYQNYQKARQLGLPIIINAVNLQNPFIALSSPRVLSFLSGLPFGIGTYFRHISIDWITDDRYETHQRLGNAISIIDPKWIRIFISDASAIEDVMNRRKDFTKPAVYYKPMDILGPNVDTVEGATWQRHRKITSPPFNERNSALVWKESVQQAQQMLDSWIEQGKSITSTSADTLTLALHVLTAAGFGQTYSFNSNLQGLPAGHQLSYRDALNDLLRGFLPLLICGPNNLSKWYMPKGVKAVGLALKEYKQYMTEMVSRERRLIEKRDSSNHANLISSLIRASEDGKSASQSLDDDEILGNLFIYNLAGHETTANTLAYVISLLSIRPEYQDWIHQELAQVLEEAGSPETWQYEEVYPRLPRCLAMMLETLRLFGPVPSLMKMVTNGVQPLLIDEKEYLFPEGTFIVNNFAASHTLPKYWGSDSLDWKPKRWIDTETYTAGTKDFGEIVKEAPVKGCYKPWGEGPRVCPGKKFAQVEFVAVLAILFKDWEVRPQSRPGETNQQTTERVQAVLDDSKIQLTLQMRNPTSVGMVWKRRNRV